MCLVQMDVAVMLRIILVGLIRNVAKCGWCQKTTSGISLLPRAECLGRTLLGEQQRWLAIYPTAFWGRANERDP